MNPERRRVVQPEGGRQMTKQADRSLTDVNGIMERWKKFGAVQQPNLGRAMYGDFSQVGSYHEALDQVAQGEEAFLALPSHIRRYCDNDLGVFLELVHDPNRVGELEELGLIDRQKPASAVPAETPTPPPEGGSTP